MNTDNGKMDMNLPNMMNMMIMMNTLHKNMNNNMGMGMNNMGMPINNNMGMPINNNMGMGMNNNMGMGMNNNMGMNAMNNNMGMGMNNNIGMNAMNNNMGMGMNNMGMGMNNNMGMGMNNNGINFMGPVAANNNNNQNLTLSRLNKEFQLCVNDNELIQIGCNFGLEHGDIFHWRVTMVGPRNTPYEKGLFLISVDFPTNYPAKGPEFKFQTKIYHLNVDMKNEKGHICLNSLNSWKTSGKVKGVPYTVKQALFDIFGLFYHQGKDSPYDIQMAEDYANNRPKFNEEARKWTEMYAKI